MALLNQCIKENQINTLQSNIKLLWSVIKPLNAYRQRPVTNYSLTLIYSAMTTLFSILLNAFNVINIKIAQGTLIGKNRIKPGKALKNIYVNAKLITHNIP